ncbi:MAG: hypothetical protein RL617_970, partial [Pseudomonadota bacterium]
IIKNFFAQHLFFVRRTIIILSMQ